MSSVFEDASYELRRSLMNDVPKREYTEEEKARVFHKEYPKDTFGDYITKLENIKNRTR